MVITDDLDGSAGAQTVAFSLDGVSYEIDLAQANRAPLAGALAPFTAAGRKVTRGGGRRGSGPAGGPRVDRAAVRAWARQAGLEVSPDQRGGHETVRGRALDHCASGRGSPDSAHAGLLTARSPKWRSRQAGQRPLQTVRSWAAITDSDHFSKTGRAYRRLFVLYIIEFAETESAHNIHSSVDEIDYYCPSYAG